jgi:hypothetical protein
MSETRSESRPSRSDHIITLLIIAVSTLIPACVCSYFVGLAWWILALGGDDDMSFTYDGPYIVAHQVDGPTASVVGRASWPPWFLAVWLAWIALAFLVVSLLRRSRGAQASAAGPAAEP